MHPNRTTFFRAAPLTAFLLALTSATGAMAQEQQPPVEPEPPTEAQVEHGLISVRFGGGSLAELIDVLRAEAANTTGRRPNIIVSEIADQVRLPAFTLRDVEIETALELAQSLIHRDLKSRLRRIQHSDNEVPVHLLQIVMPPEATAIEPAGPRDTVVISIRDLISAAPGMEDDPSLRLPVETILSAVQTGVWLAGDESQVKMTYHGESELLFVRALLPQIGLAETTVRQLRTDLTERRAAAMRRRASGDRPGGSSSGRRDESGGIESPTHRVQQKKDR